MRKAARALRWAGTFVACITVGIVVLLAVAAVAVVPAAFLAMGVLAAIGSWVGASQRLGRGPRGEPDVGVARRPATAVGAAGLLAVFATVLVPLGDPVIAPEKPPHAGMLRLPDGGRLAYGEVPAAESTKAPVILLHGGPGVPETARLLRVFGGLAEDGRDVWAYDQRGTGRSSRLADPGNYTTALAVADLEWVRRAIGAHHVVLVGHSYGAYLAAAYIARHPGRVEQAVFLSPGDLGNQGLGGQPQSRLTSEQLWDVYRLILAPRALLTYGLVQVHPAAAHNFAGDREVDARQDRVYAATQPGLHCPGHHGPVPTGMGFYAAVVPQSWRHPHEPDIRPRLAASLTRAPVPALIVKGRCDYLDWQTATRYLDTFSGSELVYLEDAGHDVHVDEPAHVLDAVKAFLRGAPVVGTLDRPHQEPAGYQPALTDPTVRPASNVETSVLADRRNADHPRRSP